MSRCVNLPIYVECDKNGEPIALAFGPSRSSVPVLKRMKHWREWIGILDGEPERDIWQVELTSGVCELHCLRYPCSTETTSLYPSSGDWLLYRWED